MNMVNFILIIVVFTLTNSNIAVSGIVLSYTLPAIVFGLVAGAVVDRYNKKKILFLTNFLRGVLLLLLAVWDTNLVAIYTLSFFVFVGTQFFIPAETPMIPVLVSRDLLLSANALFGIGIYGAVLVAYALSGPLLIWFGQRTAFLLLAAIFFFAALFVLFIRLPSVEAKGEKQSLLRSFPLRQEIKGAIQLMFKTKKIYHSLFLLALSQILVLILAVIGPAYAKNILGISVNSFPLLFVTPAALGMVIGGIALGNYAHRFSKEKSATIGVFLSGIAMLLLPYGSKVTSREIVHKLNIYLPNLLDINILHIMIVLAFILGFANALVFVPSNTILQEETTDDVRGKIYGGLNALVGLLSLIPIIVVGTLADMFGVAKVITGIGVFILLIGFLRLFVRAKD